MMKINVKFGETRGEHQRQRLLTAKLALLEKRGHRFVVQNGVVHRISVRERPSSRKRTQYIYHDLVILCDENDHSVIEAVSKVKNGLV